jgi:hypothetical protein
LSPHIQKVHLPRAKEGKEVGGRLRRQTLIGACFIIALLLANVLPSLARWVGIHWPPMISPLFASFILTPVLLAVASKLNERLLAWRKVNGRDIEEEEKYENPDADIISLRPTERGEEFSSTHKRYR